MHHGVLRYLNTWFHRSKHGNVETTLLCLVASCHGSQSLHVSCFPTQSETYWKKPTHYMVSEPISYILKETYTFYGFRTNQLHTEGNLENIEIQLICFLSNKVRTWDYEASQNFLTTCSTTWNMTSLSVLHMWRIDRAAHVFLSTGVRCRRIGV